MYAEAVSRSRLDHSVFAFGGGDSKVEGGFATFNVVEIGSRCSNCQLFL